MFLKLGSKPAFTVLLLLLSGIGFAQTASGPVLEVAPIPPGLETENSTVPLSIAA